MPDTKEGESHHTNHTHARLATIGEAMHMHTKACAILLRTPHFPARKPVRPLPIFARCCSRWRAACSIPCKQAPVVLTNTPIAQAAPPAPPAQPVARIQLSPARVSLHSRHRDLGRGGAKTGTAQAELRLSRPKAEVTSWSRRREADGTRGTGSRNGEPRYRAHHASPGSTMP